MGNLISADGHKSLLSTLSVSLVGSFVHICCFTGSWLEAAVAKETKQRKMSDTASEAVTHAALLFSFRKHDSVFRLFLGASCGLFKRSRTPTC